MLYFVVVVWNISAMQKKTNQVNGNHETKKLQEKIKCTFPIYPSTPLFFFSLTHLDLMAMLGWWLTPQGHAILSRVMIHLAAFQTFYHLELFPQGLALTRLEQLHNTDQGETL